MSPVLLITQALIAFATLLQGFENITIRNKFHAFKSNRAFIFIFIQIVSSVFLIFNALTLAGFNSLSLSNAVALFLLLTSTYGVSIIAGGRLNGGADSMTLLILSALLFASAAHTPNASHFALTFIAVQASLSYLIAGIVKWRQKSWRCGEAVAFFLAEPMAYKLSPLQLAIAKKATVCRTIAWVILFFELTFVIIFIYPSLMGPYLIAGALFHLANFYFFGLNRFFWAWISTYPVIAAYVAST